MKPLPVSLKVPVLLLLLFTLSAKTEHQVPACKSDPVKIGLLITDSTSIAASRGAELAVERANASGGFIGRPFRLVIRNLDGPWGTGSKQAVDLVFEEKVWGLIGSHDGRNAHLVEQVAAKARVVYISAWSGDPTLTQAFVPWLFNSIPNYDQQAEAILKDIYSGSSKENCSVICDDEYDSRSALKSLIRKSDEKDHTRPVVMHLESPGRNISMVSEEVIKSSSGSVVILCQPSVTIKLVEVLRQKKPSLRLFSIITSLNENKLNEKELMELNNTVFTPSVESDHKIASSFRDEYYSLYGRNPGYVAAAAFDAANLLLLAIRSAGSDDREIIQKSLYSMNYNGVTGTISFDARGNLKNICTSSGPGKGLLTFLIK